MITFTALMFNETAQEFIDDSPREYSLGWYTADNLLPAVSDGTDVTFGPRDCSYNQATNIGRVFEECAKRYYLENEVWPVLRLYKNRDCQDWLEWNHTTPNAFFIYTNSDETGEDAFFWDRVLQWDDNIPTTEIDGNTVLDVGGLYKSMVFVSVGHEDDLNTGHVVWTGACRENALTGSVDAMIGYAQFSFGVHRDSKEYLLTDADTYLGSAAGRRFYKAYDGPCFAFFKVAADWVGPVLVAPTAGVASNSILQPWSSAYRWENSYLDNGSVVLQDVHGVNWIAQQNYHVIPRGNTWDPHIPVIETNEVGQVPVRNFINSLNISTTYAYNNLYIYLHAEETAPPPGPGPGQTIPEPEIDPEIIQPEDEPIIPSPGVPNPDPYYNPFSDPTSPDYKPTVDPTNPAYDPLVPSWPYRPPTTAGGGNPPVYVPTTPVLPNPTPPSYAINSSFITIYTPTVSQLTSLAQYLWSSSWSIESFKKIFANPIDCILGLSVLPALIAPAGSKEVNVGNLTTGVTMSYVNEQYAVLNCGSFTLDEYYASYLDYNPYTKIEIYLPYIGTKQLSADDCMGKTINPQYTIDILSGACVCNIVINGTTLYSFAGSCATSIPISSNNWSSLVTATASLVTAGAAIIGSGGSPFSIGMGINAASSLAVAGTKQVVERASGISSAAGLMGIQTPYLIVTRPRQAVPLGQNEFMGYPSFITQSLSSCSGFTQVEHVHLVNIPATSEEIAEIERLLKEGVFI